MCHLTLLPGLRDLNVCWQQQAGKFDESGDPPPLLLLPLHTSIMGFTLTPADLLTRICCWQVYSWGNNSCGQLGLNDTQNRRAPAPVDALWAIPVAQLAAGDLHSAALTINGFLFTWGLNEKGQLGLPTGADAAAQAIPCLPETPLQTDMNLLFRFQANLWVESP